MEQNITEKEAINARANKVTVAYHLTEKYDNKL